MRASVWRKSTLSAMNGACVEVRQLGTRHVGVRDSKNSQGPVLRLASADWRAFIARIKDGRFDI